MAKKKVKKENSGGDCYVVAGEFAMGKLFAPKQIDYVGTPYVVHAEVKGQGAIEGLRYGHAWVEDDEWVYDFSNGREITFPKVLYYHIGNIKTDNPKKYRRYTFEEARRKMVQTGNYGCWDIETEYKEGGQIDLNHDFVDKLYELSTQKFEDNGYEVTSGSNSITDYGHSRYFYVNQNGKSQANSGLGFQVRVSDHSTGDRRILNGEQFIFNEKDIVKVFHKFNYWFNPEEYKNAVKGATKVVTIEVGEKDLRPTDEIISERVAKTGSKRFQIKRTYKIEGIVPIHILSGYTLPFKPNNPDIRFAEGGELKKDFLKVVIKNVTDSNKYKGAYKQIFDTIEKDIVFYNPYGTESEDLIGNDFHITITPKPDQSIIEKISKIKNVVIVNDRYAEGGKTKRTMKKIKRGGITYGKSHAEGGIPVKNQSTGDMLEVEGGEGIVNKRSMASDDKVTLNGREMTICEAVSQLNQMEGGVKFNCDDVEHRQFLEEMARGGELERGTRTEAEHIKVLNDLYANRLTPKEATKRIAKDHLKEDSHYYSKLAKMEGKMADGGTTADNPFAEFGLRKDFKGDAFEKLESMERVNTNYCELNMTNCSSTKGIDRKDMPQIYEEHIDEYIDFLDENGIGHEMEWGVEVGKLKPTQANISVPRIKKILTRLINGYYTDTYGSKLNPLSRRLLATKDGYILDGHHRWASLLFLSPKNKIDVFRINANINDLVELSKKFDLVSVSEFAYGGKVDVLKPNFTSTSESDIKTTIIKRGGFPMAGVVLTPTPSYNYDFATNKQGDYGYTNDLFTISVGKRSLKNNSRYSNRYDLIRKLNELKQDAKYSNFADLKFEETGSSYLGGVYIDVVSKYQRELANGVSADKLVIINISSEAQALNFSVYLPPILDNLKQGTEFFDFFFDAVNQLTKEPNRNAEDTKKKAKEESQKRKEGQKLQESKIVKSTEYPKKMKEFNPRHLYRFKTQEELELEFNSTDWKTISQLLNVDWLKKVTNRKILGLKVPLKSQYIMKFFFSTSYISFGKYELKNRVIYCKDFADVFDVDLNAYKIKEDELDRVKGKLFTIDTENYYDEKDVASDIGAKILNDSESKLKGLDETDFYSKAIQLALPPNVNDNNSNEYRYWYDKKIPLICKDDSNSFIPSEVWQFLKYLNENPSFSLTDDPTYKSFYYDKFSEISEKMNVDKRVIDFCRFSDFFTGDRIGSRYNGQFNTSYTPRELLKTIFSTFAVWYFSTIGLYAEDERSNPRNTNLNSEVQLAHSFFGFNRDRIYIRENYKTNFKIDTESSFFEEVDFNVQKADWEISYMSAEQLDQSNKAKIEYLDKIFNNANQRYSDAKSIAELGLPKEIENVLGMEMRGEIKNVFKSQYLSGTDYNGNGQSYDYDNTLSCSKTYWSTHNPCCYDDLQQKNGGFLFVSKTQNIRNQYVPICVVEWMKFVKEELKQDDLSADGKFDVSYFYDGSTTENAEKLSMGNPYYTISKIIYQLSRSVFQSSIYESQVKYQLLPKIGSTSTGSMVKKKNQFEEQISTLTTLLDVFGTDEPLKQKMIYQKIGKIRKEQENFVQKRFFKGDLKRLLELYADGQKLGGQRDLTNISKCGMQTPTGEPSELDLMQYKIVRTPEFKKWFGDWEEAYITKDYRAVSKAINPKTAEPIVCYHGKGNMKAEATYFNLANFPVKYVGTNLSYSVWFARIGRPISVVYEFYAKLINPIDFSKLGLADITPIEFKALVETLYGYSIQTRLIAEDRPQRLWQILRANPLMLKEVRDNTEYDGFIIYEDNPSDVLPNGEFNSTLDYVVFKNQQLKSADNRNGTFLIDSPDFRFDKGGLISNL